MRSRLRLLVAGVAALIVLGGTVAFSAATAAAASPENLFGATVPAVKADSDTGAVELGVQFRPAVNGTVSGVRFYKGSGNTGTHSGSVWSAAGSRLVTKTFSGETSTGWQTVTFTTPLAVTAGTTYTASYFAPRGHYAVNNPYTWPQVSGNLTGVKGVYRYGSTSRFPSSVYQTSNYWVDVVFTATDAVPPTTTATPTTSAPPTTTEPPVTTTPAPTTTTTALPSGWPDATNTGPTGALAPVSQEMTASTNGQVIENINLNGSIRVAANNVTIRNVRINYGSYWPILVYDGYTGTTITDVTVVGGDDGQACAGGDSMTILRMNCSGAADGVKLGSNSSFTDSYIHDLGGGPAAHNDGVDLLGNNITVTHNRVLNEHNQTSAVFVSAGLSNILVTGNLLAGGGYTVYGGSPNPTNIRFTNNVFGTQYFPQSGSYGPVAYWVSGGGNVWSGNTFDTGAPVNP